VLQAIFSFLLRVVAFIATLWFIKRLLHPQFGRKQQMRNQASGATSSKMVKDPVCGMYMDPRLAIRMDHKGEELFFCSDECRRKFLASPR
jgi:YHS domain-containing protein